MVSCWIQPAGSVAKMSITLGNFGLVGVNEWRFTGGETDR